MNRSPVSFWSELRRRRVFRVAAIYAATAWVVVQVAGEFVPALYLPNWVMTAMVAGVVIGFPIAVVLAWLFDIGPNGVVRTKPRSASGITVILASIGLLVLGTAGLVVIVVPGADLAEETLPNELSAPIANSIAVLPFLNLSADEKLGIFADGMSEVLIHQLAQLAELHVIARTSSFIFKGQNVDTREIGRRLNVGHVLEGSVQQLDGRIRIAAQLIDTKTGTHIWSKLFDSNQEDFFEIQDDISIEVANAMKVTLSKEQEQRLSAGMTKDYDAYELYLLGRHNYDSTTADGGAPKSLEYFQRALEIDPDFPLALAGLADSYLSHAYGGQISMTEGLGKARAAIDRALLLDPDLGEAYLAELSYALMSGDFDAATYAFERAVELVPSNPQSYHYYAMMGGRQGDKGALELLEHAVSLDPINPRPSTKFTLADAQLRNGNYDRAMELLEQLSEEQKGTENEALFVSTPAEFALRHGRLDEAVAYATLTIGRGHDSALIRLLLAKAHFLMDDRDAAMKHLLAAEAYGEGVALDGTIDFRLYLMAITNSVDELIVLSRHLTDLAEDNPHFARSAVLANLYLGRYDVLASQADANADFLGPREITYAAFAHQKFGHAMKANEYIDLGRKMREDEFSDGTEDLLYTAEFHVVAGDVDKVIEMLERAFDAGSRDHLYLKISPIFESTQTDPRFFAIIERMKGDAFTMRQRVEQARKTGSWEEILGQASD